MDEFLYTTYPEVLLRVREIVTKQFCLDSIDDLKNDAYFIRDLGADSLDVVELVMAFEENFVLDIDDEYIPQIQTVRQAATLICEFLNIDEDDDTF